jgi:benzoyl-CoA-dihydrodiol lyase
LFAVILPGSCFAGSLFEVALACDRSFMLDQENNAIALSALNDGMFPMAHGLSRLENRFYGSADAVKRALARAGSVAGRVELPRSLGPRHRGHR